MTAAIVIGGDGTPETGEMLKALKSELASYKVPKQLLVLEQLPRNAMGKVQKNVLRQRYVDLFDGQ